MKCQKCQKDEFLPFQCPYCGGYFCSEHRLPENHECPRIEQARIPREDARAIIFRQEKPYEYTFSYKPFSFRRGKIHFSSKEIIHLVIATLLVTGVGLSFITYFRAVYSEYFSDYAMLALFIIIFSASFFTHEISHKATAQRRGLWAEFRLTLMGAILTLFSIVSPFKVIAPGAVMIAGQTDAEGIGKISIAGPAPNIALSAIFLAAAYIPQPELAFVFTLGAIFNASIALFNLIPFGILDGFKIFIWNKKIWAAAFTTSLVLAILSYRLIL